MCITMHGSENVKKKIIVFHESLSGGKCIDACGGSDAKARRSEKGATANVRAHLD